MTRALHNFLNSYLPRVLIAFALIFSFFGVGTSHAEEEEQRILRVTANSIWYGQKGSDADGIARLRAMGKNGNCFADARLVFNGLHDSMDSKDVHDCGVTRWFVRTDELEQLLEREDKGEPLTLFYQAMKLGYSVEAHQKLRQAFDAGNAEAGLQLVEQLRQGLVAPPDIAGASDILLELLEMLSGEDPSYAMVYEKIVPAEWERAKRDAFFEIQTFCQLQTGVFEDSEMLQALIPTLKSWDGEYSYYISTDPYGCFPSDNEAETLNLSGTPQGTGNSITATDWSGISGSVVLGGIFLLVLGAVYFFASGNKRQALSPDTDNASDDVAQESDTQGSTDPSSSEGVDSSVKPLVVDGQQTGRQTVQEVGVFKPILMICCVAGVGLNFLISNVEMNPGAKSLVMASLGVLAGGLLGYLIKIFLDGLDGSAAVTSGNEWAGWVILAASMSQSSFFSSFEAEDLVRMIIAIVGAGGFAFVLGWGFAKIRSK
ncbi:MAG: hypothetical protein ACJ0RG_08140 [Candidatus Azotimanducaceae bacterium]